MHIPDASNSVLSWIICHTFTCMCIFTNGCVSIGVRCVDNSQLVFRENPLGLIVVSEQNLWCEKNADSRNYLFVYNQRLYLGVEIWYHQTIWDSSVDIPAGQYTTHKHLWLIWTSVDQNLQIITFVDIYVYMWQSLVDIEHHISSTSPSLTRYSGELPLRVVFICAMYMHEYLIRPRSIYEPRR